MSETKNTKEAVSDKRMKVIVVDSVKGGCGKTAISLQYAAMFAKANEKNKVCYIDLDILGSSIETFITGGKFVNTPLINKPEQPDSPYWLTVEKPALFYLNELFKGQKFSNRFLSEIKVNENSASATYNFKLIACDPDQDEKDLFKPSRLMNYVGQIDYEYFAAMIEKMLSELENLKFTHIIIDMPPNSDAYTDSVFNILLRSDERGKKKIKILKNAKPDDAKKYNIVTRYNVEICTINSLDRAHFFANLAWLQAMIDERRMEWALNPEKNFKIVFNNNSGAVDKFWEKNYFYGRLKLLEKLSIKKIVRFDYDKSLAVNAMKDCNLGFDILRESEING